MSANVKTKTQPCDHAKAVKRLADARAYYETAELVASDDADAALRGVAAGLAVLAGIAAADAACCKRLGLRSRSQNHKDAVGVLKTIDHPDAKRAATALGRLIDLKDTSHYGFTGVSAQRRNGAVTSAQRVLQLAEDVVHE